MENTALAARVLLSLACAAFLITGTARAQGVTTASLSGFVADETGAPLVGANVVAVHEPSKTSYGATTRAGGAYTIANMRVGGPYTIVCFVTSRARFKPQALTGVTLSLGQALQLDFTLVPATGELEGVMVAAKEDEVFNADRTGAVTYVDPTEVARLPSITRSTRDLTRLDPRSDGNFSFAGRNWLYNNVTLDGSYFNNPFGLDDPAPGGQAGAEPVPYDAIEQVQVSLAPFDVREGGFTGASINQVTKSGTNELKATLYTFYRDENLIGNTVRGNAVVANPELAFNQVGFSAGGPIIRDRLFFFVNGERSRRDDPGTHFTPDTDGTIAFGETRVRASDLAVISDRLAEAYDYETGAFDGYIHETNNDKLLVKLGWILNANNDLQFRWNYLDASRDLPVNPAAISFAGTGRGPNESSLPFQNAGYRVNNKLNSFALELNSRSTRFANRFFASYNRFRDFREPFSEPFPTVEIAEGGITYTTAGHEPFSIHNNLDQDVLQLTNNVTSFLGRHVVTAGANFEYFSFFNSFNLFRHGVFQLPYLQDFEGDQIPNGSTFPSVDEFLRVTDPGLPLCGATGDGGDVYLLAHAGEQDDSGTYTDQACRVDLRGMVTPTSAPFKGENIRVGQLAFYVQDKVLASPRFNLTLGLRIDLPIYFTDPVANPFSTGLTALDEDDQPETVNQAALPSAKPLWSPRVGFNWDVRGDRATQFRGGTGLFTGRVPFVWIGNVVSNPGNNPNLYPNIPAEQVPEGQETGDNAVLQTSFDLNAMDEGFAFPQVWTTDLALDQQLPGGLLGTFEVIYGKDVNAVYMRNADLRAPTNTLEDGRPFYGTLGADPNNPEHPYRVVQPGSMELNPDGGAGIYVLDNTSEGYNLNATAQLRMVFPGSLDASLAYSYTRAENQLNTTEIASVLWQENPVQGDPNRPRLGYAQFGQPHRFLATLTYRRAWSPNAATSIGLFATAAQGNQFIYSGGNRYSFIYSGDVNGDGSAANDLVYIPANESEINLADPSDWPALNAFIEQDDYLRAHRGQIAERFGAINPWYTNVDVRLLQDLSFLVGGRRNTLQLSLDIQNVANLLNSGWSVRKVASPAATSPLTLVGFDAAGEPVFDFTGPRQTYVDDPSEFSRWRAQFGIRYLFN